MPPPEKRPRKARSDSTPEMMRVVQSAGREMLPPSHMPLTERERPFWNSIVREFARADISDHNAEVIVLLARSMASLEEQQYQLREEGFVVPRKNGTSGPNPRTRVVNKLVSQVLAYRRDLCLNHRAKAGSGADAARQRVANLRIERAITNDDLLN